MSDQMNFSYVAMGIGFERYVGKIKAADEDHALRQLREQLGKGIFITITGSD